MPEVTESPTKSGTVLISLAAILILAGLAMMLFAPANWFGLDMGLIGGAAMPLGVLTAFLGLSVARTRLGGSASFGEKTAMLSLAVTAVAGAYFFFSLQHLGWDVGYPDRRLGGVFSNVITILIAGVIGVEIVRRREGTGTHEDERDIAVSRRAAAVAYGVLVALLAVLSVLNGYSPAQWLPPLTPTGVANAIILVILLAELARHALAIWIYNGDRD